MDFKELIQEATRKYKIISIIGLAKNVSKTTTLNHIIQILKRRFNIGLTSIGRDGEKYDVITSLPKPRVYIEPGTIIATAEHSLKNSKVRTEFLKKTGFQTPLGEILIVKSLNSNFIEIAGPSKNSELKNVCDEMIQLGCDTVLIDGAFDRRSYASPLISEATILSTGASVSKDMKDVINLTRHTYNLLQLETESDSHLAELAHQIISEGKVGFIKNDDSIEVLELKTALDSVSEILKHNRNEVEAIVINGAITDSFLETLMKRSDFYSRIKIIVTDTTKLFLSESVLDKYFKKGGVIKVLHKINIIAMTINPTSPLGYEFDKEEFYNKIKRSLPIPIYDLGPSKY